MTTVAEFDLEVHGIPELKRAMGGMSKHIDREIVIIVNKTAAQHRTALAKPGAPIRQNARVSAKGIKRVITVTKTRNPKGNAKLRIRRDRRLSLKEFGAKQLKGGVKYRINPKGGAEKLTYHPGGAFYFVSPKLGGHVFKRNAGVKRKIHKLHGVSVWGVYVENDVFDSFSEREIKAELVKQFNRRLQFISSGQYRKRSKRFFNSNRSVFQTP